MASFVFSENCHTFSRDGHFTIGVPEMQPLYVGSTETKKNSAFAHAQTLSERIWDAAFPALQKLKLDAAHKPGFPVTIEVYTYDRPDGWPLSVPGGWCDPNPKGNIHLSLDSEQIHLLKNGNPLLVTGTKRTTSHEIHHMARRNAGIGWGAGLKGAAVTEGLAMAFEREMVPGAQPNPWERVVSVQGLAPYYDRVNEAARVPITEELHHKWFFGSTPDIPNQFGYTLGAHVIATYNKMHSDQALPPSELVAKPQTHFTAAWKKLWSDACPRPSLSSETPAIAAATSLHLTHHR